MLNLLPPHNVGARWISSQLADRNRSYSVTQEIDINYTKLICQKTGSKGKLNQQCFKEYVNQVSIF